MTSSPQSNVLRIASIASAIVSGVLLALLLLQVIVVGQFRLPELLGSLAFLQTAAVGAWTWQLTAIESKLQRQFSRS